MNHLGAHLMQRHGDGFGWSITAKHVTLQHTAVLIPRHKGKVPERITNITLLILLGQWVFDLHVRPIDDPDVFLMR